MGTSIRRLAMISVVALAMLGGSTATAIGSAGGDSNAGDVWLDNVGQPSGPGHEMDPHLQCQDINLWGDKLADPSGTYTIDGWRPSGSKQQAYSSTWSYDGNQGGSQVISVINVKTLIANAIANGDQPAAQGFHFKLEFSQDPQKHKTFWVDCPRPSSATGGGNTNGGSNNSAAGTTSAASSSSPAKAVVLGSHSRHKAKKHKKKARRAVRGVRHQKVAIRKPAFTG